MTEIFRAEDYQDHPLYNIKAVEQATGLSAATLRAWERRYGVCEPQRSESGYRLYSDRDLAALRWLKRRLEEGLAISQAVTLLQRRTGSSNGAAEPKAERPAPVISAERFSLVDLRHQLTEALLSFDEQRADMLLSEAFAMYGVESACELILAPAMVDIGDRWHRGQITVVAEHFASHYVRRKLESLLNVTPVHERGLTIVLGCAPGDWHEVGLILMAFFLRRQGYHVIYLGQNVPLEHLVAELARLLPSMVIMSATTDEAAAALTEVSQVVAAMPEPRPIFGFGGRAFNRDHSLHEAVRGHFLGESAVRAVNQVHTLLSRAAPGRAIDTSHLG
ncbi:MerR family transcriptional regulator [Candidatus Amarolinea aalborgensis]|uniref:MerR family transcriptional regulator n=1 Tax=Candidatus Amarolinea aalborgensis TaxID=2249329 RepID=UPI003BF9AF0C